MNINLKLIRVSRGLTQQELAKQLGITQQQYSRYEVGTNKVTLETFLKILKICNFDFKIEKKTKEYKV